MTSWTVCVPSYRRAETLATRTLPLLLDRGVPPEAVEVWLSDPDEQAAYATACSHLPGVKWRAGAPTLRANRNAAMAGHELGAHLVFMDDDLRDVLELVPETGKLRPLADLPAVFDRGFTEAAHLGVRLWGISPVANGFYMRPGERAGLLFAWANLYGLVNDRGEVSATELDEKEDYERTLRCWAADGAVLRLADVAAKAVEYRGEGGMVDTRTVEAQEAAVQHLLDTWPGLVHRNPRRKSGFPEVVLRGPRARRT